MAAVREIATEVFALTVERPPLAFGFNHFLLRGERSVLVHAGLRSHFEELREAVSRLVRPESLHWIGVSHFEADECGALASWREWSPSARALCSTVAKRVNLDDAFGADSSVALAGGERVSTGTHSLRFLRTPHVPHGWDAGLFYEENEGTLFCSDLFHRDSGAPSATVEELLASSVTHLLGTGRSDSSAYLPSSPATRRTLLQLAELRPACLATMHGEPFRGDAGRALAGLAEALCGDARDAPPSTGEDPPLRDRTCGGRTPDPDGSTSRRGTA